MKLHLNVPLNCAYGIVAKAFFTEAEVPYNSGLFIPIIGVHFKVIQVINDSIKEFLACLNSCYTGVMFSCCVLVNNVIYSCITSRFPRVLQLSSVFLENCV